MATGLLRAKKNKVRNYPDLVVKINYRLGNELAAEQRETGDRGTEQEHRGAAVRNRLEGQAFGVGKGVTIGGGRVLDGHTASEGRGFKTIASDRTSQNDVQETAGVGSNAGGGQVKGETTNLPERAEVAGNEAPGAGQGDRLADQGGEIAAGQTDFVVVHAIAVDPGRHVAGASHIRTIQLSAAGETDVTGDGGRLGGLGERRSHSSHSGEFGNIIHLVELLNCSSPSGSY